MGSGFIKKTRLFVLLLIAVTTAYWWFTRPALYQLTVVNSSALLVDSVVLFGSATDRRDEISVLLPGNSRQLAVEVKPQGELRIEIVQAGNRIDTLIKNHTSRLAIEQQWLTIYPENRYIFSDSIDM